MSELNFEPVAKKFQPKKKKESLSKLPPKKYLIGGATVILIVVLVFLFSKSEMFQSKPDERMERQLLVTSRTWKIPKEEVWKYYCNKDPEGYLIYIEQTRRKAGLEGINWVIAQQFHAKVQFIDDITGVALYEAFQKHPEEDEYWNKIPGAYHYAFWADRGGYWNGTSIFWTKE